MKKAGIKDFVHINMTDFEIIKCKTPVNEEKTNEIVNYIINLDKNI